MKDRHAARAHRTAVALVLALLAASAVSSAHGPPDPREQDTRLLADQNDDCGGDASGGLQQCRGSHDLVALDIREAWDAELGDVAVFRLLLNGGQGDVKDTVQVEAAGKRQSFDLTTSDNQGFGGTFDRVQGPIDANDGTRFWVEATVRLSTLGVEPGDRISGFKVESRSGGTLGDYMPGTYQTALGPGPTSQSELASPTATARPDYALRGPGYLATLSGPGTAQADEHGTATAALQLGNALRSTAQSVTLEASANPVGPDIRLRQSASAAGAARLTLALAKDGDAQVELVVGGVSAQTTITITLTTDLGGRTQHAVTVTPAAASPDPTTDTTDDATTDFGESGDSEGIPAIAWPFAAALLLAGASIRRRT